MKQPLDVNTVNVTPEMIQAVKRVIESRDAFVYEDDLVGVDLSEEDALKIIRAALHAGGYSVRLG